MLFVLLWTLVPFIYNASSEFSSSVILSLHNFTLASVSRILVHVRKYPLRIIFLKLSDRFDYFLHGQSAVRGQQQVSYLPLNLENKTANNITLPRIHRGHFYSLDF